MDDTDPNIRRIRNEILAAMSPARKLALLCEANRTARALAVAGIRRRHPGIGPAQIRRRLLGLLLGEDLATRVYGPLESPT